MKQSKKVAIILIFIISVSAIVVGTLFLRNEDDSVIVRNQSGDTTLTEEQYQLLEDSIHSDTLNFLNDIERKNAWLILNLMEEIGFEEAGSPSRVSLIPHILEFLDFDVIQEVEFVRIEQEGQEYRQTLIMRVTNDEGRVYYLYYHQGGGLVLVLEGSEEGERVYGSISHMLYEGQLCEIDFENSTLKNCLDRPE